MRWEVSGRTAAILWDAACKICLKQYATSLCSSHPSFAAIILLEHKWCNYTVVLTQQQLGKFPVLFYEGDRIYTLLIIYSL